MSKTFLWRVRAGKCLFLTEVNLQGRNWNQWCLFPIIVMNDLDCAHKLSSVTAEVVVNSYVKYVLRCYKCFKLFVICRIYTQILQTF